MAGEDTREKMRFNQIGKKAGELVKTFRRLKPTMDAITQVLDEFAEEDKEKNSPRTLSLNQ